MITLLSLLRSQYTFHFQEPQKEEKQDYMKVLVRYLHERLLFRISASPYKNHFLLKGSSLLYALDGFKARPTIDIDLLGERISNDGVHRTVTVMRDSVTSVTSFFPVITCQQNKGKHPLRMLASYLLMDYINYSSTAAWAAARRAIGTRNGEQLA